MYFIHKIESKQGIQWLFNKGKVSNQPKRKAFVIESFPTFKQLPAHTFANVTCKNHRLHKQEAPHNGTRSQIYIQYTFIKLCDRPELFAQTLRNKFFLHTGAVNTIIKTVATYVFCMLTSSKNLYGQKVTFTSRLRIEVFGTHGN